MTSFVFQISEDMENWSDIERIELDPAPKTANVSYNFDISSYNDGVYYVRAVAYDKAGNVSICKSFVEYRIDNTPPMPPTGVRVEDTEGEITIVWDESEETNIMYYNVYRSEDREGSYTLVRGKLSSLGYIDRNVEMDKTYYYRVSAINRAGNESDKSNAVEAKLDADNKPPEIISVSPKEGSSLPVNPTISVLAADNYKLAQVTLEYDAGDEWVLIGSEEVDVYSEVASFNWDTYGLTNGRYDLRAKAVDKAGNESKYYYISYNLYVEPPIAPELTAVPGDWKVNLSWTTGSVDNLAGFYVYRSTVSGSSYRRIKTITDTSNTSYEDGMLTPGQAYYYVVKAVDVYGNISRSNEVSAIPGDNDPYPPTADAGEDRIVTVGMEVILDGRGSSDNDRIEGYIWDFGDGTKGEGATPSHIYTEEGVYEVTLTVFDPAGNSDTDTINVKVHSLSEVGVMEVRVIDDATGEPVGGASVYVDFPDDTPSRFTADSQGVVHIVGKTGRYNIAAYKEGYLPKEINAQLNQYKSSPVTIGIEKGELVVGELDVRRMELDEIIEAGIDVTAPENQYVYEFEVTLEFERRKLPKINITTNGAGHIYNISFAGRSGDVIRFNGGGRLYPTVIPHKRPDVPPTIAYLVIPGEVSWLKEFFEVSLTMTNMADAQFVIEDASAALDLPEGLTLAPTRDEQSLMIDIGSIEGGETKEVQWIIRGDEKGSYDLKAHFNGTLMPFNDPVNAIFKAKEPLEVLAGDAMHLNVLAQDSAYIGEEYYVFFQLTNTSDFPVYNLHFEVDGKSYADTVEHLPELHVISEESIEANEIHQVSAEDTIEVPILMPGDSIWLDYSTIIDFEGDPSRHYYVLTNSYVEKRGVEIPTTVKTIPSHIYKYRLVTNRGTHVVTEREDISVIMDEVNHPGNTVITVHDNLKEIETEDKTFLPVYYGITTTADIEGNSLVEISYDITGYEEYKDSLRLYHIKDGIYTDITESTRNEVKDDKSIMIFEGRVDNHSCYFAVGFTTEQKSKRLLEVFTGGDGSVKLNGENINENYKNSVHYGTEIKLTAIAGNCSEFAYWEDGNTGRFISTNPVYETTFVTAKNIKAIFHKKVTEDTEEFTVVFKDRSGRILQSTNVAKNQSATPPEDPTMSGYQFIGWDKDYSNVVSNMMISPVFERLPDKYNITVEGGTLYTGETTGEYRFDMPVNVIAGENEEGMKFSHWEQDGIRISVNSEISFFMPKRDTVLTAVFVEDTEIIDTTPFITLLDDVVTNTDDKTMIFIANRNIREDYMLLESGMILLEENDDYQDKITLETEGILRGRINNDSTDQFYVRKINVLEGERWYARAYMICEDSDGSIITVYSENTAKGIMPVN
ncbi:PKD domain-containing protein [Herbivorax sp. ANBcel31]|uniref:PKD domain-containing protein n=1 Tax=Herbivorax sp. ANBcel31 TaxID=3069754 RepID=UPI0027B19A28|nr:PKD domain-containing protein [Herbivorax sp. ANBcel31]MDQ2085051.1 PKD domain-containing protein [Herbivorax sp. ANBcel31]